MPEFLNDYGWQVNGFIADGSFDALIQRQRDSISTVANVYAFHDPLQEPYRSDESFSSNSYQYIPTEQQVGAGIAALNMQAAGLGMGKTNDYPTANNPAMTQLAASLYQQASALWQEMRIAHSTGEWG